MPLIHSSALLTPRAPNDSICSTPECIQTAQDILADMNFNVDPCSDFYQYTCGSWIEKQVIPDNRASNGTFEALIDNADEAMRSILEGTYEDLYKNLAGSDEGFHTDEVEQDKQNFEKMQTFYSMCVNQSSIDSLGPTPIYEDIAHIENKLFPVNDALATLSNSNATDYVTQANVFLQRQGIQGFNYMFTYADDKNPGNTVILLDQPTLTLPAKEYYADAATIELLRSGLNDYLYKVIGEYSNGTSDSDLRASESNRTGFQRWSQNKIKAAVDRFVEFETKLANVSLPASERQSRVLTYNPIKLSDFQSQHPMIDWSTMLRDLVPDESAKPGPNTTIIIRVPAYYNGLNEVLSTTNVTLQTLQEYFIIAFALSKSSVLDETTKSAFRAFNGQISLGLTAAPERWKACVTGASAYFPNTMARYYVLKKFGGEVERKKVESFIDSIHQEWLHRLDYVDWLDNATRAAAIEKVKLLSPRAAYGTTSPDIRNPASIAEYNQGLAVNKTSFYDTFTLLNQFAANNTWKVVGKKLDQGQWLMPAQTVNAYYEGNKNQIVVPAGILQTPFYTFNAPEYLNYGGIGTIVGHEITHGFDSSGRSYDGHGLMTDWWTNETTTAFEERAQCFVDQYSKFNITAGNKTLNVNGALTLSENIADNGGLSASFLAYETLQANKTGQRLQGLEQLSPEALFFVNFGRVWCTKQKDELAQQMIYVDPHSPSNARVNGAVQNSDAFATTFNCPIGSPMNPEKKCRIW